MNHLDMKWSDFSPGFIIYNFEVLETLILSKNAKLKADKTDC